MQQHNSMLEKRDDSVIPSMSEDEAKIFQKRILKEVGVDENRVIMKEVLLAEYIGLKMEKDKREKVERKIIKLQEKVARLEEQNDVCRELYGEKITEVQELKQENEELNANLRRHTARNEDCHCVICMHTIENAVTLVPCLHTFCGGCVTLMADRVDALNCPLCQSPAMQAGRNSHFNNLVQHYVSLNPELRRPLAEREAQEAIDFFNLHGLRPIRNRNPSPRRRGRGGRGGRGR